MSDTSFRNSFEFPQPNRKQIAFYLKQAKTSEERKVWRDMLKGECFIKPKNERQTKVEKKVKKDLDPKKPKKK